MAGEHGFEPWNGGFKGPCLTTWRLPKAAQRVREKWTNAKVVLCVNSLYCLAQCYFTASADSGTKPKNPKGPFP